jgi:hypothetical protein
MEAKPVQSEYVKRDWTRFDRLVVDAKRRPGAMRQPFSPPRVWAP